MRTRTRIAHLGISSSEQLQTKQPLDAARYAAEPDLSALFGLNKGEITRIDRWLDESAFFPSSSPSVDLGLGRTASLEVVRKG